jgi:hypothetical protein
MGQGQQDAVDVLLDFAVQVGQPVARSPIALHI